jgi:hypothetical protein
MLTYLLQWLNNLSARRKNSPRQHNDQDFITNNRFVFAQFLVHWSCCLCKREIRGNSWDTKMGPVGRLVNPCAFSTLRGRKVRKELNAKEEKMWLRWRSVWEWNVKEANCTKSCELKKAGWIACQVFKNIKSIFIKCAFLHFNCVKIAFRVSFFTLVKVSWV